MNLFLSESSFLFLTLSLFISLFLSRILFGICSTDQRVQNYFSFWLDYFSRCFLIFSFRYKSIYAVLFTIEKAESRTKSREFLLFVFIILLE